MKLADVLPVLVQVTQSVLALVGLLTVVVVGIRYIAGMVRKHSELSEIDEKIKKSLREQIEIEVQKRETVEQESAREIRGLFTEVEIVKARLGEKAAELDSAVTMSGACIIVAEVALGYGSERLRQLHEAEIELVRRLHERFSAALLPALPALVLASTNDEKVRAVGDLAGNLAEAHSAAVLESIRLGQRARQTAALLASLVPAAIMESGKFSMTTPGEEIISAAFDRMDRDGMALAGNGKRIAGFLHGGGSGS